MTVNVSKPAINVREKLAELDKPTGIAGEAMLRAETPQEQFNLIGAGRRNLIINGDMRVAQRGTSQTLTSTGAKFAVDRFVVYKNTGSYTLAQVADGPDGFKFSAKITVDTAGSASTGGQALHFEQKIEGYDAAALAAGTSGAKFATLSFWVKSSVTGMFALHFGNDTDRFYNTTYDINTANTWEYKTITVQFAADGTWNYQNNRGLEIVWSLLAGNLYKTTTKDAWVTAEDYHYSDAVQFAETLNATWQITGVQLELGKVATPFEHRSYGEELALCQRYYWQTQSYLGGDYAYDQIGQGFVRTTNTDDSPITIQAPFPVPMRVRPAIGPSTTDGAVNFTAQVGNTGATIDTIVGTWQSGVRMAWLDFDLVSNPFSVGQAVSVYCNGGSYTDIQFDAEL